MVDVFISYPRKEREKVEPIKAKFEALGLDIFFDLEGIDGGENFPDVITRALRASKSVLCCWSPLYFERPWCLIECRYGLKRGIMVPVAVEAFDENAPPADLEQVNWFSLLDWGGEDVHEDWNRTLLSLGKLVGRELAPPLKKTIPGGQRLAGEAPAASAAVQARADILADLRTTWAGFAAKTDADAVRHFLNRVRAAGAGSGLEFEVEHHLDELGRSAEKQDRHRKQAEANRKAQGKRPLELPHSFPVAEEETKRAPRRIPQLEPQGDWRPSRRTVLGGGALVIGAVALWLVVTLLPRQSPISQPPSPVKGGDWATGGAPAPTRSPVVEKGGDWATPDNSDAAPTWKTQIVAMLERNKRYPEGAQLRREQGVAQVSFSLDRQGRVIDSQLTRSSGVSALDEEALALVRRAQPFPPPPPELPGARVDLTVPIRFNLNKPP